MGNQKNLLLVSISAPPKNSPESLQTGRYLLHLAKSYQVSLLTTKPARGWAAPEQALDRYLSDVNVIQIKLPHARVIKALSRFVPQFGIPDEYALFHRKWSVTKIQNPPDIIYSRSTPFSSACMALKLKSRFNVPWVMHLSDLWVDSPFYISNKEIKVQIGKWEQDCFQHANAITVTSKRTLDFYQAKYPQVSERIHFLPNVIEAGSINQSPPSFEDSVRFVFTGRLYGSRSPKTFLEAVDKVLSKQPGLETKSEFVFAGFMDPAFVKMFREFPWKNVRYIGPVTQDESIKLQRSAHVLLLIDSLDENEMYDYFFPSKLIEYFAARRRVLAVTRANSTVAEMMTSDSGDCFSEKNIDLLANHLLKCIDRGVAKDSNYFFTTNPIEEFTIEQQVPKLRSIIDNLIR